ncbi:MAG: nucleotidyltransferase substrate binding protein [Flavobacteriales bacterium]
MIDTSFLERCIDALEKSLKKLEHSEKNSVEYDIYRSACIKEFELILEQSGKLLKKTLKPYFHSSKEADKLTFKDIFRHAAKHSIISTEEAERWLKYRDNRNTTAHDYGSGFAEETLRLMPEFIKDAHGVTKAVQKEQSDEDQE